MIPDNINREHFIQAINEIDRNGVSEGRHSSTYDVIYNGKTYPPKLIISLANKYANGSELDHNSFRGGKGTDAFKLLEKEGFEIIAKKDPVALLVENYKHRIASNKLKNETYKWELLEEFHGKPNTEAEDFYEEIKTIKFKNLIYPMGYGVLKHIAKVTPEELRRLFMHLHDENKDLTERVKYFNKESLKLYRQIEEKLQHHQDERSISAYLTFHNPEKYTFYKSSFYKKYCKLLGLKPAKTNEKYAHYLSLVNEFIEKHITPDQDLIEQVKSIIPDHYDGTNHMLLAQDILYQMFDQEEEPNYWIFQGNPKVFDFESAMRNELLNDFNVSAHKDKIKAGDKVIIWITGENAGCYGLAEVTSEPYQKDSSTDDALWKEGEAKNKLKADIEITDNWIDRPILKNDIKDLDVFADFKGGNQGTNFTATKDQFEYFMEHQNNSQDQKKYWLYAPGENASLWDEFYHDGIFALGWGKIGDLKQYNDKNQFREALIKSYGGEGSKKNDVTANDDFVNNMNIGDIVIVKKGRTELLGYGIITSDYIYDANKPDFNSLRKVNWILKGNWTTDFPLALKTLTDITKYPSKDKQYNTFYEKLLGIMNGENSNSKNTPTKMKHAINTILYGPPGTGKTYNTAKYCAEILTGEDFTGRDEEARTIFNEQLGKQIEFVTFHQNYSYEDFIQGLRPDIKSDQLSFDREDGIFKVLVDKASKNLLESKDASLVKKDFFLVFDELIAPLIEEAMEVEVKMKKSSYFINEVTDKTIFFRKTTGDSKHTLSINSLKKMYERGSNEFIKGGLQSYYEPLLDILLKKGHTKNSKVNRKNYIIVIDEINRANISRVFGELITLIEEDKRSDGATPLKCKLPSGDEFQIPSNLYILGTMNTADKSIALLDIALRRRFEFIPLYPDPKLASSDEKRQVLTKINERIFKDKGPDFQIGHAYFMNNDDLLECMNKKVIPLLSEYYMNATEEVIGLLKETGFDTTDKNTYPIKAKAYNGSN